MKEAKTLALLTISGASALFLLVTSGAVGYYFFKYVPEKEKKEQQLLEAEMQEKRIEETRIKGEEEKRKQEEKQEELDKKQKLLECLELAYDGYTENWNAECTWNSMGPDNSNPEVNCLLPVESADRWDEWLKDAEDQCYKLFN